MAFTVSDFSDFIRLLAQHPEWQVELRRLILTEDLLRLPAIVQELAEAQRQLVHAQQRTEERLKELVAIVARLETAVEQVAEAQRRAEERMGQLEERVGRLEAIMEQLAEAQRQLAEAQQRAEERMERLEAAVEQLTRAQQRMEERMQGVEAAIKEMGQFQRALGATIEEEAESVLLTVLEEKGYRLLAEPSTLSLNGEIDIVVPVQDPTGEAIWVIVEVQTRLSRRVVRDWAQRMKSAGWQKRLRAAGVPGPYLVYVFGLRIDQHTVAAVQEHGIGLLTGRGERVPPRGVLAPRS